MEEERDDEAATEERGDQDEEEEEDDEGEDIDSVKIYVKSIIAFDDDDDKRNPHATSSPKGNITIMLHIIQYYSCTILYCIILPNMKYKMFYLCNLQLFPNY